MSKQLITHEQAKKSRNELKYLLNRVLVPNTYYAKDINVLLDYITQQKEQGKVYSKLASKYNSLVRSIFSFRGLHEDLDKFIGGIKELENE